MDCSSEFDLSYSMAKAPLKTKCIKCGKTAHRNWNAYGDVNSQMKDYDFESSTGMRMYTASYLPTQTEEMKKKHHGRDFKLHNGCYLPVIKNRRDKIKYLKERSFVELD